MVQEEYIFLLIFGFLLLSSAKRNLVESIQPHGDHVSNLLSKLQNEKDFGTIFVLNYYDGDCINVDFLQVVRTPAILMNSKGENTLYIKSLFNSELLALVCLSYDVDLIVLKMLASSLQHIRQSRIIFVWKQTESYMPIIWSELIKIVKYCQETDMINIIIVFSDFYKKGNFYSFREYPQMEVEQRNLFNLTDDIFPQTLQNLQGKPIIIATTINDPGSMLYVNPQGQTKITGYLVKFVQSFVEQLKGNFTVPFPIGDSPNSRNFSLIRGDKNIDMAIGIQTIKYDLNLMEFSYPLEIIRWMIILPTQPEIAARDMFFTIVADERVCLCLLLLVVSFSTLLSVTTNQQIGERYKVTTKLDYFIHEKIVRSQLAASVPIPNHYQLNLKLKFVYLLTWISGLIVSNMYAAYLQSYVVSLPLQSRVNDFDDLLEAKYKILIPLQTIPSLVYSKGVEFWSKYKSCFQIVDSMDEYDKMRNSLNTSYAYSVGSALWPVYEQQMQFFSRQPFYINQKMHINGFMLRSLPIRENSIYKTKLDQFVLEMHASGMLQNWVAFTFYDMLTAGKISMQDTTKKRVVHAMKTDDLFWIWSLYIYANILAILVYGAEHLVFYWKQRIKIGHSASDVHATYRDA